MLPFRRRAAPDLRRFRKLRQHVAVAPGIFHETAIALRPQHDGAVQEATKKLRDRVEQLEAELQKSRTQIAAAQKDRETLSSKLQETNGKLDEAQKDLEKTRGAEKQVRDQLASAQDSLKKAQTAGNGDSKAQEALKGEINQLKNALAAAEKGRTDAQKERDAQAFELAEAKNQVASVSRERDSAIEATLGQRVRIDVAALVGFRKFLEYPRRHEPIQRDALG